MYLVVDIVWLHNMKLLKPKVLFIGLIILVSGILIYALLLNNLALLISCICLVIYGVLIFFIERKKIQEELNLLSVMIDRMMNQERVEGIQKHDEFMSSKIQHQLEKVNTLFVSKQEDIERDRDEIRLLINDIAHQMRTPITNMKLYLELLELEELTQTQQQYVDSVEKAMDTLSFLSENFIRMSRIEGKIIQLKSMEQSLTTTIYEAITVIDGLASSRNVQIHFDEELAYVVSHDFHWMKEAIINLLDNAIKYSYENSDIYIQINENEMFMQIEIIDQGIGVNEEEEAQIFQRFYRGQRVSNQKGLGLGLYITRMIIQTHDGYIKVKRKDRGSIFSIILPK